MQGSLVRTAGAAKSDPPAPDAGARPRSEWLTRRRAAILAFALTGLSVLWLRLHIGGARGIEAFADLSTLAAAAVAAVSCAMRARREQDGARRPWVLLALGCGSWAVGETIWSIYELALGLAVPFPSTADIGFLALIPFGAAALLSFHVAGARFAGRIRMLLDGLIIGGSVLFVSWAIVLGPLYHSGEGSLLAQAIGLAYPVGDVVIASLVVFAAAWRHTPDRGALAFLGGGLLALALADTAFAYLTLHETYASGGITDVGWTAAFLLVAVAGVPGRSRTRERTANDRERIASIVMPYAPFAVALAVAGIKGPAALRDAFLFWSGFAIVVLVVTRQLVTLVDNLRLNRTLEMHAAGLRAANAELVAADQMKTDFLAVASHELRTPLTSIVGSASTMIARWDMLTEADKRDALSVIDRQARRLARLTNDLLTMSRIDSGAIEVRPARVDLQTTIDQAVAEFGERARRVRVRCAPALAAVADPDHVHQVLINFVGNALKYGKPPVSVEVVPQGDWILIRVRDHGAGVPGEFVPRLFGKFAQASMGTTRTSEGTGLGLSIVQGLARAHGGDAWYEPNRPSGSCFSVRLPGAREASAGAPGGSDASRRRTAG